MTDLILDTNILLRASEVDVYDQLRERYPELRLSVLDGSLNELSVIETREAGSSARQARLAREMADKQDLYIVSQSSSHVDAALLAVAERETAWIATQDKAVQQAARERGLQVLALTKDGRFISIH